MGARLYLAHQLSDDHAVYDQRPRRQFAGILLALKRSMQKRSMQNRSMSRSWSRAFRSTLLMMVASCGGSSAAPALFLPGLLSGDHLGRERRNQSRRGGRSRSDAFRTDRGNDVLSVGPRDDSMQVAIRTCNSWQLFSSGERSWVPVGDRPRLGGRAGHF